MALEEFRKSRSHQDQTLMAMDLLEALQVCWRLQQEKCTMILPILSGQVAQRGPGSPRLVHISVGEPSGGARDSSNAGDELCPW